jgi:erythromycin esterase
LTAKLEGAQIVGIGEVTHGDHEDQTFKAELIKALVMKGQAQVLILESNRQVGADLDVYINGKGGNLPVLLRSPSFFRIWRTDEFASLILWLRAYNVQASQPVFIRFEGPRLPVQGAPTARFCPTMFHPRRSIRAAASPVAG